MPDALAGQQHAHVSENPEAAKLLAQSNQRSHRRMLLGCLCIAVMVTTWVAMAELLQGLDSNSYNKPYFQRWIVQSFYVLGFPMWAMARCIRTRKSDRVADNPLLIESSMHGDDDSTQHQALASASWSYTSLSAAGFGTASFVCGYVWYLSLPISSVAANTTIYQSAAVFVYLLSIPILACRSHPIAGEPVSVLKVLAVMVSLGGVGMIAFSGHSDCSNSHDSQDVDKHTAVGDMVVLLAAVLYAAFEVSIKVLGPKEESPYAAEDSCWLIGLMGLGNMLLLWPGIIFIDAWGIEHFEWPSRHVMLLFLANGAMDCLFNSMLVLGIALTSPLFITCGTMLAIPGSILWDLCFHGCHMKGLAYGGVAMVILGFLSLNLGSKVHKNIVTS